MRYIIGIFILFSSIVLIAEDEIYSVEKSIPTTYDRVTNVFSDYDGSLIENMAIYSMDIFLPDEIMRASKDVIQKRKDQGHSDQIEQFPKSLANDSYNIFLTTLYYYIQDVSQITKEVWADEVCNPDTFVYILSLNPKINIVLKESDDKARGISDNGIVLPFNPNFPKALYPYAQKPDGCSTEGLKDFYKYSNSISDDKPWLSKACDKHDKCYYTIGTSAKTCNAEFITTVIDACDSISLTSTVKSMGMKNMFCGVKGLTLSTGANACAKQYFAKAQRRQEAYLFWIEGYEKNYAEMQKKAD